MPYLGFQGPHTDITKSKISLKLKGKRPGGFNIKVECKYCKNPIAKPNLKRHTESCKRLTECKHVFPKNTNLKNLKHFNICLKSSYKIDIYEYVRLFDSQDGLCKICRKKSHKTLCVDHCHKSGKVRGLLCSQCNHILGLSYENIEILSNCIKYLNDPYKD
jgi:hypothetical protein